VGYNGVHLKLIPLAALAKVYMRHYVLTQAVCNVLPVSILKAGHNQSYLCDVCANTYLRCHDDDRRNVTCIGWTVPLLTSPNHTTLQPITGAFISIL
jgi:hypothetical protein